MCLTYTIKTPVLSTKLIRFVIIFLVLLYGPSVNHSATRDSVSETYRLVTLDRSLRRYNIRMDVIAVSSARLRPKLAFMSVCIGGYQ